METLYYYADPLTQQQKGPISITELQSLLTNKVLSPLSLVWNTTLPNWTPIQQIYPSVGTPSLPSLVSGTQNNTVAPITVTATESSIVHVSSSSSASTPSSSSLSSSSSSLPATSTAVPIMYYYADDTGCQMGPVAQEAFISLLEAGYINKRTLVWTNTMDAWLPMIDYPPLVQFLGQYLDHGSSTTTTSNDRDDPSRKRKRSKSTDDPSTTSSSSTSLIHDKVTVAQSTTTNTNLENEPKVKKDEPDNDDNDDDEIEETLHSTERNPNTKRSRKKKNRNKSASTTNNEPNTWIYITGLPVNTNEHEIMDYFRKAGMIRLADGHGNPRIHIYRTTTNESTGSASSSLSSPSTVTCSVCYLMPESVELAIDLFDGALYRPGYTLTVEEADRDKLKIDKDETTSLGSSISHGKPNAHRNSHDIMYSGLLSSASTANKTATFKTRKLTPEEHTARIRAIEQAARLSWAEEGDETFGLRIVVIKHMFNPYDPDCRLPTFEQDLVNEIQPEFEAQCGTVHKIIVFPHHPDGVVLVKFKSAGSAVACLNVFSGRYFGGQTLQVELWDGHTDYRIESIITKDKSNRNTMVNTGSTQDSTLSKEEEDRLDDFGKWLESGGND